MTNELSLVEKENTISVFENNESFQNGMMMAAQLAKSDLIPVTYKNKPENCVIALELSNRLRLSPFLVMQNMHVIQGRPSWSSTFIISCINASGKFKGCLKFEMDAKKTMCRAYAIEKETDTKVCSPLVTLEMATAEGWLTKNGSKWKTMPELMLRYRAAAFFGRIYCPEIMNGMLSMEEAQDIGQNEEKIVDLFTEETILPEEETPAEPVKEEPNEQEVIEINQPELL